MKKLRDILEKNETVIYKTPERTAPPPKNWVQSMFRVIAGEPKPEPVRPVQPLPQFDKNQSAMPDMDTMVKQETPSTTKKTIPNQTGVDRANILVGSFPKQQSPEPKVAARPVVPQSGFPAAEKPKAPIPTAKPEQSEVTLKKGQTIWDVASGDPKEAKRIMKLNQIRDPKKISVGFKLKLK